jgi:hypothetical protein
MMATTKKIYQTNAGTINVTIVDDPPRSIYAGALVDLGPVLRQQSKVLVIDDIDLTKPVEIPAALSEALDD